MATNAPAAMTACMLATLFPGLGKQNEAVRGLQIGKRADGATTSLSGLNATIRTTCSAHPRPHGSRSLTRPGRSGFLVWISTTHTTY